MTLQEALKVNEDIKIRRAIWTPTYYLKVVNNMFRDYMGVPVSIDYSDILASDWEVLKEPCKHEPTEFAYRQGYFLGPQGEMRKTENTSTLFSWNCKRCGVKIRAEKWIEA